MTDLSADCQAFASCRPANKGRFVTAARLLGGHGHS